MTTHNKILIMANVAFLPMVAHAETVTKTATSPLTSGQTLSCN